MITVSAVTAGTRAVAAAAGLVLAVGVAGAEAASVQERIEARLLRSGVLEAGDVQVATDGDAVVLTGTVRSLPARDKADRAARKEARTVVNRIQVEPEPYSDGDIAAAVERAILGYPRYSVFDAVGLGVEGGVVILRGYVLQPYRSTDIAGLAAAVAGVREVRNEIAVAPVSSWDDQLRMQLYHAIYGHGQFIRHAGVPNPPVRILVDRGRVTLVGQVGSPLEQALLGHIARGVMSFDVRNQVEVESKPAPTPAKPASTKGTRA